MTSFAEIRQKASLIPDEEVRGVCLKLIDEVAKRQCRANQGLWTINVFSRWTGRSPEDSVLNRSVQLLASRRDAQLLEMHFIYFRPEDEDDPGRKIADDEVVEALKKGYLVDSISGEIRPDFETTLVPYFVPAPGLEQQ